MVALRDRLNWFETLPLFGRRVLVTRTMDQAGMLSRELAALGALPIEIPTIEVRPLDDYTELDLHLDSVAAFDWIVFSSASAVRAVRRRLEATGQDVRALHGVKLAAIGPATSSALTDIDVRPDLVPDTATSAGLSSALAGVGISGSRILLPRADIATRELPERLASYGAAVQEVEAYRTVPSGTSRGAVRDAIGAGLDAATFTSASTVRNLVRLLDGDTRKLANTVIACIGPVTAAAAGELGLNVDIVAPAPTIDCLVQELAEHFAKDTTRR